MPAKISDYAMIGDCETAALISRDGSIDWLCLPRFDSGACFAALLGTPENGRWQIKPATRARIVRQYRPQTLVLETTFRTSSGQVTLIDFMPARSGNPRLVRMVRGDRGSVNMQMDLVVRFDYGLTVPWVSEARDGSLHAVSGAHRLILRSSVPVRGEGLHTVSEFQVKAGQTITFDLRYGRSFKPSRSAPSVKASLRKTEYLWKKWVRRCTYKGEWRGAVERSLITLKALTYVRTGGMVAAPTTSLPEQPGGRRNWDYRFCWVRDATFTLLGFLHAGYKREARQWKNWLARCVMGSPAQMQIMYGVTGERLLREWPVPWLKGYAHSAPVLVGNAASEQLQLDIYGELADALHQSRESGGNHAIDWDLQINLLEHLGQIWREPDQGIWEVREKARQFTHSKVMAWVAFDRTIRSAEKFKFEGPIAKWRKIRDEIHAEVCRLGFDPKLGSFVQYYGSNEVDASLLLLPLVGFLPAKDARVLGTIHMVEKRLMRHGFVMRYRPTKTGNYPNERAAFLPCSFWLADCYELAGRHRDAQLLLRRLLKVANDVGLLSEEYMPTKKLLVGNFPQALTHVALVNTAINLQSRYGPAHQRANHRGR